MGALRSQIAETQKTRSDLMKWKLVIVAALGGAALGINTSGSRPEYLLCLIPFACVYVDALCAHLSLRVKKMGEFLAHSEAVTQDDKLEHQYEVFLRKLPSDTRLEAIALLVSTTLLSLVVVAAGFRWPLSDMVSDPGRLAEFLSGAAGFLLSLGVWRFHRRRVEAIVAVAKNLDSGTPEGPSPATGGKVPAVPQG